MNITREFLMQNTNVIFVFGDNLKRVGTGGAAALRDLPNTYGFITKKEPSFNDAAYYRPEEYIKVYQREIDQLKAIIRTSPGKIWYISKLGSGLANKYHIWEEVISKRIKSDLKDYVNIVYLWDDEAAHQ